MKVGLMLPAMASMEINEAALQGAEALGMDSVWLPDHLLGPCHPGLWPELPGSAVLSDPDTFLDPFCVAAVLGRSTELSIGTCVTDATRRRGPDLARTALTLQQSGKGDFVLGIGSGEAESLVPFGYDFDRPVGLLERALEDLRSLLDTGRLPGDGVARTGLAPDPSGHGPQVWVAGNGPRALRLTGTYADGWLPMGTNPEEYARQRRVVNEAAEAAGRPAPVASMFPLVLLGESRDHVAALFEENPATKMILLFAPASLWQRYGLEHPSGPDCRGYPDTIPHALELHVLRDALARVPREMAEEFVMTGNAGELAEQLTPYREAGLEHVVIADLTGMTYPPDTAAQLMPELARLRTLLQDQSVTA